MNTRRNQGFTLVEILIVVVILGILAAIVIPQFSSASTEAKENSLQSSLQTMRSQISLYKIQHNDKAPTDDSTFEAQMTGYTDIDGATVAVTVTPHFGPYLQSVPVNPFTGLRTVGPTADTAWRYEVDAGGTEATIHAGADTTDNNLIHQAY